MSRETTPEIHGRPLNAVIDPGARFSLRHWVGGTIQSMHQSLQPQWHAIVDGPRTQNLAPAVLIGISALFWRVGSLQK